MAKSTNHKALLIHPRGRLSGLTRVAIRAAGEIDIAQTCFSHEEAVRNLDSGVSSCDIVFVSSSFSDEESKAIQDLLARHPKTYGAPVIVLVDPNVPQGEIITQLLLGYDGVLMQPFSIEELLHVVEDAFGSLKQEQEKRQKRLMKLLVRSVRDVQSDVAGQMKRRNPSRISRIIMKELSGAVRDLPAELCTGFLIGLFNEYLAERKSHVSEIDSAKTKRNSSRRSSAGIFVKHLNVANMRY